MKALPIGAEALFEFTPDTENLYAFASTSVAGLHSVGYAATVLTEVKAVALAGVENPSGRFLARRYHLALLDSGAVAQVAGLFLLVVIAAAQETPSAQRGERG